MSKNFATFFFDEIWKIFKGISLIKTEVDFSRYRVRIPVGALSFDHKYEKSENRKVGKSENRKFRKLEIRKIGGGKSGSWKSENREMGNSENWKIGKFEIRKLEIWKIEISENRKLEIRTVGKLEIRQIGNWKFGKAENQNFGKSENWKIRGIVYRKFANSENR